MHKEAKPEDKDYMYPEKLYQFWATIPEPKKKDSQIVMDTKTAQQMFHRYYNTRLHCLWDHCCKRKGTKTYEWKVMLDHWKNFYPAIEKKDKDLEFESDTNAKNMIENWMSRYILEEKMKRELWLAEQQKLQEEQKKKNEEQRKKLEEKLKVSKDRDDIPKTDAKGNPLSEKEKKKVIQKSAMEKLSTPKDRLIRGKTFAELKTRFPDDKILQKMLITEFANDRIVKKPLEYDYMDSEEEDRIKMRENKTKGKRSKSDEKNDKKGKSSWVTTEAKEALRAKELMKRFKELTDRYDKQQRAEIEQQRISENKIKQEKQQFDNFIHNQAKKYRANILAKNNQEVPSENDFLSDVGITHLDLQAGGVELQELRGARVQAPDSRREQEAQREKLPAHLQAPLLQGVSRLGQREQAGVGQQGRLLGARRQLPVEEPEGDG